VSDAANVNPLAANQTLHPEFVRNARYDNSLAIWLNVAFQRGNPRGRNMSEFTKGM